MDLATQDGTVIPFKFVLDQPDLQDLRAEIQKLRKQTNTQPTQASE